MSEDEGIRHSRAEQVETATDDDARARLEAANSLRQAERMKEIIWAAVDGQRPFRLRTSIIQDLNRCAIEGLDSFAGNWRPAGIEISKSKHSPPPAYQVAEHVEDMCDYVNDNWDAHSAVHLSSFVMWRLNWIHPFTDGNGRTSRAASYVVLCVREGFLLPGSRTIPEQITEQFRTAYYDAIEAADERYKTHGTFVPDIVIEMEELIAGLLAKQLAHLHKTATGQ